MVSMGLSQSAYNGFIGQYLKELRQDFKFSQLYVSSETNINRKQMSKLENDLVRPTYDELGKIDTFYSDNNKLIDQNKFFDSNNPIDSVEVLETIQGDMKIYESVKLYHRAASVHPLINGSQDLLNNMREQYKKAIDEQQRLEYENALKEGMGLTQNSFEEHIAQKLLTAGFYTNQRLEQARAASNERGDSLLDTMISNQVVAQETLVTFLSFNFRIPVVDLSDLEADTSALALLSKESALDYKVCPIEIELNDTLRVATRSPNNDPLRDLLSSLTEHNTKFVYVMGGNIDDFIEKSYAKLV